MNIEEAREICLAKDGSNESLPFDDTTLVFKLVSKMFAVIPMERQPHCIVLKCDPTYAIELREKHEGITSAWHFNKQHWNAVQLENTDSALILELIEHSYNLVYKKLTKKEKELI